MALNKKPYKGTRDFFPKDKRTQEFLFEKMRHCAALFGYEPYDGPLLEEVELYKAKSGEELINDQIYSFTDRGDRHVAIRPEMTPTLARMVAQIHREESKPIRWYAIPNLMRYEQPQKGRLREHWQFNCDIFGASGFLGEIEILQMAVTLLQSFGANESQFEILVNNRKIVDFIFQTAMNLNKDQAHKLYKLVDKQKKVPEEAFEKMLSELGLNKASADLFKKYLALKNFEELSSFLKAHKFEESNFSIDEFNNKLKDLDLHKFIKFDPTIVRGLDYYTGVVFEIFDKHPENRRAICGGGAYENLLGIFGEDPLPGIGFGLGDVTLTDFLRVHGLLPNFERPVNDLYMTVQTDDALVEALKVAKTLRANGIKVISSFASVKINKAFTHAEKKGAKFIGFIGDEEMNNKSIQIKNLATREQLSFSLNNLDAIVELIKK